MVLSLAGTAAILRVAVLVTVQVREAINAQTFLSHKFMPFVHVESYEGGASDKSMFLITCDTFVVSFGFGLLLS